MRSEGASEEDAFKVVDRIWTIINDAASYMFCAAHAFSMACDSLYAAYLKVHHPYEFYTCMLKLYTEKGNKEKIAAISREMNNYLGITVITGRFGQDNRDWYTDELHKTISQNLNSIKYISSHVASDLYKLSQNNYETFTDLLFDMMMKTPIDSRQTDVLIILDYFREFGKSRKLQTIHREFREGKNKITKTLIDATVEKRLDALRKMEKELKDEAVPLEEKLKAEQEYLGRCISYDENEGNGKYFVEEVEEQYGVKLHLYNMRKGTIGVMKCTKALYGSKPVAVGQCLVMNKWKKKQRYSYHDGQKFPIEGVADLWIEDYDLIKGEAA